MTHSIRRWLNAVQTLTEAAKKPTKLTPAQRFVQTIQAGPRCEHCTFEVEGPRTVLLTWIEGGGGLVPYLTQIADQLRVKLTLMVEVVDTAYGGKLVRYYEKNGFKIKESDFDDDFDFMTMEPDPSDEMKGQVYMEREPAKARTLGEDTAAEAYLYHGTAQARLPNIQHDGLIPAEKSRWSKDPFIGDHSIGKIHFVDSFDRAVFYAREASKTRPAILRVLRQAVADLQPDPRERDGAFYSERAIAPEHIERWNGKRWVPLI